MNTNTTSGRKSLVYLGSVWPEPESSAAGVRSRDLIRIFLSRGWKVTVASIARENSFSERLQSQGIEIRCIAANDPEFDAWIRTQAPDLVLFDRFILEEQFGWRVEKEVPGAARVIDMQDFHALRRARERAFDETGRAEFEPDLIARAGSDLYRELGSIYRSDLTLVISRAELELLKGFGVPEALLHYFPLICEAPAGLAPLEGRAHFAAIGNFRHAPNADAFRWLHSEIWPRIRTALPRAELHVYGAYPSREIVALTDKARGFHVRGQTENAVETLARYRVNLAPLRFGAGLKGKIVDGWRAGTPAVTTPIGAEGFLAAPTGAAGLMDELARDGFGGAVVEADAEAIARAAIELHESDDLWRRAQFNGARIVASDLNGERHGRLLGERLDGISAGLAQARRANLVGAMLREHQCRSTEYFSRWIETKNRLAQALQTPKA